MTLDELTIDFRPLARGEQLVLLTGSSYGGAEAAPFQAPYSGPELEHLLDAIEAHLLRATARGRPFAAATPESDETPPPIDTEAIGARLFDALFSGPGGAAFEKLLHHAEGRSASGQEIGLRLRLVFSARDADLATHAAVPWELLFRAATRDFLARIPNGSLIRHIDVDRPIHPIPVTGPLRVLLVDSAPVGYQRLDLPEERRRIREALKRNRQIEVHHLEPCDPEAMRTALRKHRCHVLHFMGHGDFDLETGEGTLIFETPALRGSPVPARGLDDHLKGLPHLGLVVLNACTAGAFPRREGLDPFKGVAPALTMAGIPATIAMQFPISDRAAIAFSSALYEHLAAGEDLETAVGAGRRAILRTDYSTLEWATPVLYSRSPDGRIFEMVGGNSSPAPREPGVLPVSIPAETPLLPDRPLHLGIPSMKGWGPTIERDAERVLDLTEYFEGRRVRDPMLWRDRIFPRLRDFLLESATEGRPLLLDFAAHWTLAFAVGFVLEAKSGLEITVRQRTQGKPLEWTPAAGEMPEGPFWLERSDRPGSPSESPEASTEDAHDVAVAIGVTRPVLDDVEHYLRTVAVPVSRILDATVHPEPSLHSVRSGAHALHLAHTLERLIRSRTLAERYGTLHLFASAPNALLFFLGQLARPFGRVQLYEHNFDAPEPGKYMPSLCLPPE